MTFMLVSAVIVLIITTYYFLTKNNDYWKKKGVSGPKPEFFFGHMKNTIRGKMSIGDNFAELYKENKQKPYIGVFMMQTPTLMVNDLDMIRNILTKDFEYFSEHLLKFNSKSDLVADHLFNATGARWKNMRAQMTPTFTTSKMKEMFDSIAECCHEMVSYLNDQGDERIYDVKELLANLSTNIIGTCAFGIDCNTFKDPNSKFRIMGRKLFNFSWWQSFLVSICFFFPDLVYNSGFSVLGKEINNFYYNIVKDGFEHRKKNNIVRKDFFQILMGMLKDDNENDDLSVGSKLTLRELAAQAFVFFVAGFESSSSVASFTLYEMALNPDIQSRLVKEIKESLEKNDGKITYDSLKEMSYLDKVINETFRKHPTLPVAFRKCTKDYKIPETDVIIEKGTPVMFSMLGIQKDPNIFPNPEIYDPERFSEENKALRHPFSILPFGEGPRVCIAKRFGLMQTKLGVVTVLSNYQVEPCVKTVIPLVMNPKLFIAQSKGGVWLRLKKRSL